jgi:hypothetical protein
LYLLSLCFSYIVSMSRKAQNVCVGSHNSFLYQLKFKSKVTGLLLCELDRKRS